MKLFTIDSMCENEITYTASNHNAFELFNSILNQEDENKEYCLISNEPLNETRITLPCGHCFNYLPLLYDLINYKKAHYNNNNHCPYCRETIYGTIPYRYDISKIHCKDINYPTNKCYVNNECCYKDCSRNATIPHLDDTYICYRHYKLYINKKNRQEIREKNKEDKKKKQTLLRKSQRRTRRLNETAEEFENEVVANEDTTPRCKAILKTGKRKGECCNAKLKNSSDIYCKRHNK